MFVPDMLKNSKSIKEEEQRCIMSIQVLKHEEKSSFGENAATPRWLQRHPTRCRIKF